MATAAAAAAEGAAQKDAAGTGSDQCRGPWLQLASRRVLLDAAVGQTAIAEVVLRNVGSVVVYYCWQQQEQQELEQQRGQASAAGPDSLAPAATPVPLSGTVFRPSGGLHSPQLAAPRAAILPGQQVTVQVLFRPDAPGVYTQCWGLVTAPQLMADPGQLELRGYATGDDAMVVRRARLAEELAGKQRRTQVKEALQVALDRAAKAAALRAAARGSSGARSREEQAREGAFVAANAAEWPPVYYRQEAWTSLQQLHGELLALLRKLGAPPLHAPPHPPPRLPSEVDGRPLLQGADATAELAAQLQSLLAAQQQQAAAPAAAAAAAGKHHHSKSQPAPPQQEVAAAADPPADPEAWAGSLQHLRLLLLQLQHQLHRLQQQAAHAAPARQSQSQQQEQEARLAELTALLPRLQGRLEQQAAALRVPSCRRHLLRHCLAAIVSHIAGQVADAATELAADASVVPLQAQGSAGTAGPLPAVPSGNVAAQPATKGKAGAGPVVPPLQLEVSLDAVEQQALQAQRAAHMQRLQQAARKAALEGLGRLEGELALAQVAAGEEVAAQVAALEAQGSGSSAAAAEELSWRAFALLRALQRSRVV